MGATHELKYPALFVVCTPEAGAGKERIDYVKSFGDRAVSYREGDEEGKNSTAMTHEASG